MNSLSNLVVALSLDTLAFGGQIVVIGMATIFAVLTLLMFALKLFELIFSKNTKEKESSTAVAAPETETLEYVDDSEQIVAVIAAAIAAAEAEHPTLKFKVVSFRRK